MNSTRSLERDVFISYAHVDNTGFTEEQQGWVSAFDSALQKRLAQLLGRKADIWRDRKLTGADRFAREIVDQFANLKVLVSIVSPRYLESKWCRKELETFIENAEHSGGARVGNKTRVFKVVKTPVPRDQYPPVFSEVLGYDFFELTNEARFREFTLEKGSPTYYKFIERFEDVAQDICQLIKMLDAGIQHHDEPDREKTVYLAKSTSDLDSARDNIRRDLEKRGYTVFPDQELPVDGRFRAVVEAFLQRCILAIHLIGNKYGVVPEDEQCSMVEIQHALSQLLAPKRLIWIPESGIGDIDPRQQRFIDDLLHGTDTGSNTDLLNGSLEELKTVIIDTLEKPSKPESAGGEDTGRSEIPRVYLIFDESDRDT
ncbi:MAG: TIR domain-containing protein, partial [Gammaproteobacteria bacterium]